MAATQRIDSLVSEKALSDFDKLFQSVNQNITAFEALIEKGVQLNNTLGKSATFSQASEGAKALSENEKDLVKQISALQAANDKLTKQYEAQAKKLDELAKKAKRGTGDTAATDAVEKSEKKLTDQYTAEARAIAINSEQTKLAAKANREAAKESLGLVGAYDRLLADYEKAAKETKDLSIQFGANSKEAKESAARTLELDRRIKEADSNVGRFNKNVGNYSGALKVLQNALIAARQKQDDFRKSGQANADVMAALEKEEKLLTTLVASQAAGFASGTQEVKKNTQALEALAAAGLKGTDAYNNLFKATADLKDEVADLKTALKNAAPDDVAFDAAAEAARGLVGVYGLAKSASAIFGDENEALQETLVKLQAAETALQSIEAVRLLFKKESSVQQAIGIGLQKIEVAQTYLATAAESKNIVIRYAAIAAQKVLNAVMLANPILLVVGALALLAIALSSFSTATRKAQVDFRGLSLGLEDESKKATKAIDQIKRGSETTAAALEAQHASQVERSKSSLAFLTAEGLQLKRLEDDWFLTGEAAKTALKKFEKRADSSLSDEEKAQKENAQKIIDTLADIQKARAENTTAIIVQQEKLQGEQNDALIKARQIQLEVEASTLNKKKAIYETDADNAEKSFDTRIEALKKANDIEIDLINKKAKEQKLTPGQTPEELKLIETDRANAVSEARRKGNLKLDALQKEQIEREKNAQLEIAKIAIETRISADQKIADNQDESFTARISALTDAFTAQQNLIEKNRDRELDNAKLTATERKAIEDKADADSLAAKIAFFEKTNEITVQNIEKENAISLAGVNKERDEAIKALNNRFEAGKISLNDYNKDRKKLEEGYFQEVLQVEIDGLQKEIEERRKQGKDVTQLEAEVAAKQKEQSEAVTQKKIADLEKVKAAYGQVANEAIETFKALVEAGYDKEKNAIQAQIEALEDRKNKEIEVADRTILNEQDKAAAISTINIRAQAEKEALERRQKQLDIQKAKFEKAITIGKIIADTARAVVEALPNIPLSVAIGLIGALQLVRAIATPIPTFEHGTTDAPGGLSLVGEKRKELVITPEGRLIETPDTPTLMNIPKHSIVLPDAEKAMRAGVTAGIHQPPTLVNSDTYYKYMADKLGSKIDTLNQTIKNKKEVHIARKRDGWQIMTREAGNQKDYLNSNLQ